MNIAVWIAGVLAYLYLLHQLSAVGRSAELELGKKLDTISSDVDRMREALLHIETMIQLRRD